MIKVYEVSRKYIMLFMHNNRYLLLTGLLTLLQFNGTVSCEIGSSRRIFRVTYAAVYFNIFYCFGIMQNDDSIEAY